MRVVRQVEPLAVEPGAVDRDVAGATAGASESSQPRSDGSIAATDVTSPGYQRTLSPLPKPISSTRPCSPAQAALRSSSSSGPPQAPVGQARQHALVPHP